jgi:hypothetical protein
MQVIKGIYLAIKVISQALETFNTVWAQIKLEIKEKDYTDAAKTMDKAVQNYHGAIYKKDMAAAAAALHDLATGGVKK